MLFTFLAMAQSEGGGSGGIGAFLPIILIFVIFWFLILRPQAKKQKMHQRMLEELTPGDKIVTTGGIHATILKVNDEAKTLSIKAANDIKLTIDRGAVARILRGSDRD